MIERSMHTNNCVPYMCKIGVIQVICVWTLIAPGPNVVKLGSVWILCTCQWKQKWHKLIPFHCFFWEMGKISCLDTCMFIFTVGHFAIPPVFFFIFVLKNYDFCAVLI